MLNMENTILSANVLHSEDKLLIACVVMVAICCILHIGQVVTPVVTHFLDINCNVNVTRRGKKNDEKEIKND